MPDLKIKSWVFSNNSIASKCVLSYHLLQKVLQTLNLDFLKGQVNFKLKKELRGDVQHKWESERGWKISRKEITPVLYKHCNKSRDAHTHHWLLLDRIRMIWLYVISLITSGLTEIFLYVKLQIRSRKCELHLKCFLSSAVWLLHAVFCQTHRAKGHAMLQWLPEGSAKVGIFCKCKLEKTLTRNLTDS